MKAISVVLWVAGLAALVLLPLPAPANIGPPVTGGQRVAEPVGMIKDVEITRETLTIDLRPLVEKKGDKQGLAQVEAVYHLYNRGTDKKTLDLMFAFGSAGTAEFHAWLGDQAIDTRPAVGEVKLPESWRAPRQEKGDHSVRSGNPMLFTVVIPPGQHSLKVRYTAAAAYDHRGNPTVKRLFDYVLAPARSWAGFGGLDVTIHVPEDWHVDCEPSMTREGNTLKGSFANVPADAIILTVQAPEGPYYQTVSYVTLSLLGLAAIGGLPLCVLLGRAKGRSFAQLAQSIAQPALAQSTLAEPGPAQPGFLQRHAWPLALAMGVFWGLAILATGLVAVFSPDWVLPAFQASHYGYGQAFAMIGVILLSLAAVVVGFAVTQLTAVLQK